MTPKASPDTGAEPYVHGAAGASARREYERRHAKDEDKIREKWGNGRFGRIAVALSDERQSTDAWRIGAAGELRVATELAKIASERIRVLHDRRIPGSRANIDHIVVTAGAIWAVDAKKYSGRPELRVEGGILRIRPRPAQIASRCR